MYFGDNGIVLEGVFVEFELSGLFNGDQMLSVDVGSLVYVIFYIGLIGLVYIWFNINCLINDFLLLYGIYLWVDMVVLDFIDIEILFNINFGFVWVVLIGDFNGDGYYDIYIGLNGWGYSVILY